MPENMTDNKRERVRVIFAEAYRMKTSQERSGYLDEACGSDTGLRAEVESLLEAHDKYGKRGVVG